MAQHLRACSALPEDLGSSTDTHIRWLPTTCNSSCSKGSYSSGLCTPAATHTDTERYIVKHSNIKSWGRKATKQPPNTDEGGVGANNIITSPCEKLSTLTCRPTSPHGLSLSISFYHFNKFCTCSFKPTCCCFSFLAGRHPNQTLSNALSASCANPRGRMKPQTKSQTQDADTYISIRMLS